MINASTDLADGLPVMPVGSWAREKHDALVRYIDASRAARKKFGYASYIDLFSGPGRVADRETGVLHDGSPLLAWRMSQKGNVPFSKLFIGDLDSAFVGACASRLQSAGAEVQGFTGDASQTVEEILAELPRGLHLAFIDPFNIKHLDFSIIQKLASQKSVDILVHFSVMDIQRNIGLDFNAADSRLEAAAPGWRATIDLAVLPLQARVPAFLDYWERLVGDLTSLRVSDAKPLFINTKRGPLYRLIHLSRHPLAEKLWNAVGQKNPKQGRLSFD